MGAEREGSGREGGSGVGGTFSASSGPPILERRLGWTWGALEGTGVWGRRLSSVPEAQAFGGELSWSSPDSLSDSAGSGPL